MRPDTAYLVEFKQECVAQSPVVFDPQCERSWRTEDESEQMLVVNHDADVDVP